MNQKDEIINIQKSEDYSKFSFIKGNRTIDDNKVKEYEKMIENGYIQDECPILVTQKLEILDGQHRFMAAKNKNTPIFYIISKKSAESNAMIDINRSSSSWTIHDHVHCYSERGNENYRKLIQFCRNNKISYGIATICFGFNRRFLKKVLISGKFVFNEEKKIEAEIWLTKYREFLSRAVLAGEKNLYQMAASYSFLEAVMCLKNKKDKFFQIIFDHRHLISHSSGFKAYVIQFISISCCDE